MSEEAASPAEATARSAGRSLLSWLARRPKPTADPRPLTLWILFRAIAEGGWRPPPERGRGQGRDGEGVKESEAASVIAGRPEEMESSEARARRDQRRAEAHSAPEPAAAVTASPGSGLFMRCRPSSRHRRRGRGLFLLSSAPPPQPSRIPPPRSQSPGLGLGRRLLVGQPEGQPAAGGPRDARVDGRAAPPGWGRPSAGWAQAEGQVGRRGDWRARRRRAGLRRRRRDTGRPCEQLTCLRRRRRHGRSEADAEKRWEEISREPLRGSRVLTRRDPGVSCFWSPTRVSSECSERLKWDVFQVTRSSTWPRPIREEALMPTATFLEEEGTCPRSHSSDSGQTGARQILSEPRGNSLLTGEEGVPPR